MSETVGRKPNIHLEQFFQGLKYPEREDTFVFFMRTEYPRLSPRRQTSQSQASDLSPELGVMERDGLEVQVSLEKIEVSDGTVGWNVIRSQDRALLGDIIRISRVRPGGRPRFSYYGKRVSYYFGQEFRTKAQAIEYIGSNSAA
jgi:hypothetical protein